MTHWDLCVVNSINSSEQIAFHHTSSYANITVKKKIKTETLKDKSKA